jgi:diguanylate cyclase (GGDEF)-like protein
MKLLLIEDDNTDADFLRSSLQHSRVDDIELTHVSTLKDGTSTLRKDDFDVVLLDIRLPDGNGMECVEAVQNADPKVPIVVLSSQDDEDFAISILNQGVHDYLVKWEDKGRIILRAIRYAVERKRAELQLNYLTQHDNLTGIPNREFLPGHLDAAIARAERGTSKVALFYIDLNKFKAVNDMLGFEAGDLLLKEVAQHLYMHTRAGDALCRLGGNQFALVVEGLEKVTDVEATARKLINSLNEVFLIDGREIVVTASVGITVYPDDGEDTQNLLKNADIAMYQAKESGPNEFKFFTKTMHDDLVQRHKLAEDVHAALGLRQFSLVYQPKVDMQTYQLMGIEALIRWNCPTRGLVRPDEFLHAAEESGDIVPLGYWMLDDVCRTIQLWKSKGLKIVPVSINISVRQFQQADFVDKIVETLKINEIDPELIELELTEGLLMDDIDASLERLNCLKEIGLKISIDDFGTGNSCLAYLRKFPIDILKIDKSFVADVTLDADCDHICKAIISLAKSFGLKTVAEGIETERQLEFLRESGCDIAQGYLFGHPIWGKEIIELLEYAKNKFASIKPAISFKSSDTTNSRILNAGAKYLT